MLHLIRQSRWYTFAVVAIAATLLSGALARRSVEISTASATINQRVVPLVGEELSPDAEIPEHFSQATWQEIASAEMIRRALASDLLLQSVANSTQSEALIEQIARSLTISEIAGVGTHDRQITIRYSGSAPDHVATGEFVTAIVETLAQQYVDLHQGHGADGRLARWHSAQQEKRTAQAALDAAHIQLRDAQNQLTKESAAGSGQSNAAKKRNPRWLELHKRLLTVSKERSELVNHVTEHHPDLQKYDAFIADLSRQLSSTEQWVAIDSGLQPFDSQPTGPRDTSAELSAALVKHHRGYSAVRQAELQKKAALAEFEKKTTAQRDAYNHAAVGAQLELRWRSTDAVEHTIKQAPRGTTSLALILALASGGFAAVCIGRPDTTLRSAEQVRQLLAVPVLAVMRSENDPPLEPTAQRGWWLARAARLGAEVAIFAFLAATIVCLTSDPSFAGDFTAEPLTTLGSSIERTWMLVGR